jgi:5-methylcytosine-specific restriction endonuclease McrA
MRVAVLSRDYEPLTFCNIERAIALLYLQKAEIIKATGRMMRSISSAMPVPAVIRLLYRTTRRHVPIVKYSRRNVHARDNFACQYCGNTDHLTIDHVYPLSRGGRTTWENVVTACRSCNGRKGNRTPEEANMPLRMPPRRPAGVLGYNWAEIFE